MNITVGSSSLFDVSVTETFYTSSQFISWNFLGSVACALCGNLLVNLATRQLMLDCHIPAENLFFCIRKC